MGAIMEACGGALAQPKPTSNPHPCYPLQLQHTRKEWDLNRPDHKQIDSAARVGDNDPRIGAASMQKFEGEDLSVSATALAAWGPHLLDRVNALIRASSVPGSFGAWNIMYWEFNRPRPYHHMQCNMCLGQVLADGPSLSCRLILSCMHAGWGPESGSARPSQVMVGGASRPEGGHEGR